MRASLIRILCGVLSALIASLALWGWSHHDPIWAAWIAYAKPMMPATAIYILLASLLLFIPFWKRGAGNLHGLFIGLIGMSVAGIGFFNAAKYILQINILYASITATSQFSLPTSLSFIFLGFGMNFLNDEMPIPHLLVQKTLRHSLIRSYLGVSLLLVAGGSFFTIQSVHRLIVHIVPGEILSTVGSAILDDLIHYTLLAVTVGICFVIVMGLYLSLKFQKSFEGVKTLAHQIETGDIAKQATVISNDEWQELKDLKISLAQVGQHLVEARKNLEEKMEAQEKTAAELRDSQRIAVSLLEDTDDVNRQLMEAKEELQQLNFTLEVKVEERTSELLLAQEKLIRSEKLAALGQLSSAVAHEIRNPLTGLTNAAYFLKLCEKEIGNEEIKKNLLLINKQVGLINQIVSNLLDFARVKEPDRKKIDIAKLIQETIEKYPPPVNVHVAVDVYHPGISMVDPFQIGQVFGNLMTNAYQAMSKGGELKITTDNKTGGLNILFEDTGPGIPPENLAKIFEPLYSTKPKGTGLGLAICRQLMEKHGGKIEVESKIGKGSRFIVKLPLELESIKRGENG